jgi:hypothetical protein
MIERRLELDSSAACKRELIKNAYRGIAIDEPARLVNFLLLNKYLARQQQRLRFVPAFGQAAINKQLVYPSFHAVVSWDQALRLTI